MRSRFHLATQATLRTEHPPGNPASGVLTAPFENGIVRFFTSLFTGNENAAARARIAASSPDSAGSTLNPGFDEESKRARIVSAEDGANDT